jgi:hypothetical protein
LLDNFLLHKSRFLASGIKTKMMPFHLRGFAGSEPAGRTYKADSINVGDPI